MVPFFLTQIFVGFKCKSKINVAAALVHTGGRGGGEPSKFTSLI